VPARLLYSSRSYEEIIYREELERLATKDGSLDVFHTLTRSRPKGWNGYERRIDPELLEDVGPPPGERPLIFCGPTPFVLAVATALVDLGYDPTTRVKTERFGPTGG
jgi:ferredoxin-NADP reductase